MFSFDVLCGELVSMFFFFNDTATTEIYTLSLHDALPICVPLEPNALEYFRLHIEVDVRHGEALREGLIRSAPSAANQEDILRGARRSLDARAAFWSALGEQLFPGLPGLEMAA